MCYNNGPSHFPAPRFTIFMEDFYETGYTPLSPRGRDKKKVIKFVGIFIIALALLLIGLGILGATAGKKNDLSSPTPTIPSVQVLPTDEPTPEPSPTPEEDTTPSPTQKVTPTPAKTTPTTTSGKTTPTPTGTTKSGTTNREDLSIEIQNGSGINGAAGQASTLLKGLGYKVLSTGNADNYDYAQMVIKVKAEKKEFLTQLKLDLGTQYKIESATSDLTGSTADAIVIVGKE